MKSLGFWSTFSGKSIFRALPDSRFCPLGAALLHRNEIPIYLKISCPFHFHPSPSLSPAPSYISCQYSRFPPPPSLSCFLVLENIPYPPPPPQQPLFHLLLSINCCLTTLNPLFMGGRLWYIFLKQSIIKCLSNVMSGCVDFFYRRGNQSPFCKEKKKNREKYSPLHCTTQLEEKYQFSAS